MTLTQSAPEEYPVLRPHRLAVGFYDLNEAGSVVRTERFELDVDGESTQVDAVVGKKRPACVVINDDDLTYTKIRLDEESVKFAEENLYRFEDSLARALVWLSFWDVTRDGEYPAERFIGLSLKALSTEQHSTTFRYAIGQLSTAAHSYVGRTSPRDRALIRRAAALGSGASERSRFRRAIPAGAFIPRIWR
jgi:aminopeptidase N